jgi:uncharacterized protein YacL
MLTVVFFTTTSQVLSSQEHSTNFWAVFWSGFGMLVFVLLVDIFTPKSKLSALAGVFFGLIVGVLISAVLAPAVDIVNNTYNIGLIPEAVAAVKWLIGICICFLTISMVMSTKDDIRFVVPYVEFAKQIKGARPLVLDTSAIIDGRIADLYQNKIFDAPLVVPKFVLNELHLISDSPDKLKRNRGRRGLDILSRMQRDPAIDIEIDDVTTPEIEQMQGVDQKLVVFTKHCDGRLATTDYNLTKVAQVRNVDIMNMNDLANSLKTIAMPGEMMEVRVVKPGEDADQGIGYLDDGTMIVIENGRDKIGKDIAIAITSSLQTAQGKMIFGKFEDYIRKNNSNNQSPKKHNENRRFVKR